MSLDATIEAGEEDPRRPLELGGPHLRLSRMLDNVTLRKAIDQLAAGYKEVFILHNVEGYKHHDVTQILGCSIGNSKSQLFKARLKLRHLLKEAFHRRAQEEH